MGGPKPQPQPQQAAPVEKPPDKKSRGGFYGFDPAQTAAQGQLSNDTSRRNTFLGL